MSRHVFILSIMTVLCGPAALATAQTGDGYVGVYADGAGTAPCATSPPNTGTTLYVLGKAAGATAGGILGAEFRIEVTDPTGWFFTYTPPAGSNIVLGSPLDLSSLPGDESGVNITFSSCAVPQSGNIALGTIAVFNANGSATQLLVKQHNTPRNPGYPCPLFVSCDTPVFSKWCMATSQEDPCSIEKSGPSNRTATGAVFTATLNVLDPGQTIELRTADQQVLAMFAPGIIELPVGQSAASLNSVAINSMEIESALQANGVTAIARAITTALPFGDFSELYRIVLPNSESRSSLIFALGSIDGVIYANENGGAAYSPLLEETEEVENFSDGAHKGDGSDTADGTCIFGPPTYDCSYTSTECPNDPDFGLQWALLNVGFWSPAICGEDMGVEDAWKITRGSGITVELLGNGITRANPDLEGRIQGEVGDGKDTPLAGVMAANTDNGMGITGLNWMAQVKARHVADEFGRVADDAALIQTLAQVYLSGNRIVLNAFRLIDGSGLNRYSDPIRIALRGLYMHNLILVSPMGNSWCIPPAPCAGLGAEYPAAFPSGILSVGASTPIRTKWEWSKTGPHIDLVAPGQVITTTTPSDKATSLL